LGIKKIDADVELWNMESYKAWVQDAKTDSLNTDYLLINSKFESRVLPNALWYKNNVIEVGHPRNDIFFGKTDYCADKVREKYSVKKSTKLLLYAPSFRDNLRTDWLDLNCDEALVACKEKFGGNWVMMLRLHPKMSSFQQKILFTNSSVIDVTDYPDIQELLVVADVMITDYSSCVFDFVLSRKPAFIFAPDIKDFDAERGFYYPLSSTPFSLAENNEQLRDNIINFNIIKYQHKVANFFADKKCIDDGFASARVVDLIENLIRKEG
jgi:CDP-glycerol glycerophosphotransferase